MRCQQVVATTGGKRHDDSFVYSFGVARDGSATSSYSHSVNRHCEICQIVSSCVSDPFFSFDTIWILLQLHTLPVVQADIVNHAERMVSRGAPLKNKQKWKRHFSFNLHFRYYSIFNGNMVTISPSFPIVRTYRATNLRILEDPRPSSFSSQGQR